MKRHCNVDYEITTLLARYLHAERKFLEVVVELYFDRQGKFHRLSTSYCRSNIHDWER